MVENNSHATRLLLWYDKHARDLPWRRAPGLSHRKAADPYHVWLSEIMLQQTVVKTVIPYFETFLFHWPDVFELAACDLEEVLKRWAGLGYYARARNLHKCAQVVAREYGGIFPRDEKALLSLPGIGPYTASAVRAIAFDEKATVVDGNVERVVSRLHALKKPPREIKAELKQLAAKLTPSTRPGDYAQAMMDLGATVCTPKSPSCNSCPLKENCAAFKQGCAPDLPVRAARNPRPTRTGTAFLVLRDDGSILLRQRPDKGLLAKMLEVPATRWCQKPRPDAPGTEQQDQDYAPISADWQNLPGLVTHTFTHFHLQLTVRLAQVEGHCQIPEQSGPERCRWVHRSQLKEQALPGIMRKIIAHGLDLHKQGVD